MLEKYFTTKVQNAMDELVCYITEKYVQRHTSHKYVVPTFNENLYSIKEHHAFVYFDYGIYLMDSGIFSELMEIILQAKYDTIVKSISTTDEEFEAINLQLLFVKSAIMLLYNNQFREYIDICGQVSTIDIKSTKSYETLQEFLDIQNGLKPPFRYIEVSGSEIENLFEQVNNQ